VKFIDEYVIPFHGLKEEIKEFSYTAGTEFFEFYQNPEYSDGRLKVNISLLKNAQFIELKFKITGHIKVICDRCLEDLDYPVSINELIIIKFGDKYIELDDNVVIIPKEQTSINIAQYIYEFAILSIPFRRIHSEKNGATSGCNPEMIKKIIELNSTKSEDLDPRWEKLKKIKLNK
jgi:uncharacterized protein